MNDISVLNEPCQMYFTGNYIKRKYYKRVENKEDIFANITSFNIYIKFI